jgi:hypothetical protein
MFGTCHLPISWGELFKRTAKEFSADNCLGLVVSGLPVLAPWFFRRRTRD